MDLPINFIKMKTLGMKPRKKDESVGDFWALEASRAD